MGVRDDVRISTRSSEHDRNGKRMINPEHYRTHALPFERPESRVLTRVLCDSENGRRKHKQKSPPVRWAFR